MRVGPVVDVHTHVVPMELLGLVRDGLPGLDARGTVDEPKIVLPSGLEHPVTPIFCEVGVKLEQMDRDGIDLSIVSVSPSLILAIRDLEPARRACRAANDGAAAYAAQSGGRIRAMASVPVGDVQWSVRELRRAREDLGLVGVQIGTSAGEKMLDDPGFEPFFAAAQQLEMPVMLHPYRSMVEAAAPGLERFHLANVIGNPHETFVAAARLIMGGVLDRHEGLQVVLVHGGGSLPYQLGRLSHAWEARDDAMPAAREPPLRYASRLLYDTVLFEPRALEFLVGQVGPGRVLYGTDLPFDMADPAGIQHVEQLGSEAADAILSANARRAYGVGGAGEAAAG